MSGKKFSPIGLDFTEKQIKVVQLKQEKEGLAMFNYELQDIPSGYLESGLIRDAQGLQKLLKQLLKSKKFKGRAVNFNISGQQVNFRSITLPRISAEELAEAIYWEAEKYLEGSLEDPVVDYLNLREKEEEGKIMLEVLLVAASKKVVKDYVKLLHSVGLDPLALEIKPVSLFRMMQKIYYLDQKHLGDGCMLTLDINDESTSLIIMDKGKLLFARNINMGRDFFQEKVAASQQEEMLSLGELFRIDIEKNMALLEAAETFLLEVVRSLEYFTYYLENREKAVTHLFLTGPGSRIYGLSSFLSKNLHIESHYANPFYFLVLTDQFMSEETLTHALSLPVALGSCLRNWP